MGQVWSLLLKPLSWQKHGGAVFMYNSIHCFKEGMMEQSQILQNWGLYMHLGTLIYKNDPRSIFGSVLAKILQYSK